VVFGASGRRKNITEKLMRRRDLGLDCEFEAYWETAKKVSNTAVDHN